MKLELPVPPSANVYWRIARGHLIVSEEARQYRRDVALLARKQGLRGPPLAGPVVLSIRWHRARKAGDLSNRIKVLEDALQGLAYRSDDQVVEIHALRLDDASSPRVVVRVEPADGREEEA
jgi:crossover junction endodeoxyribonuclease RusA